MRTSTISKSQATGAGTAFARALGSAIKERRARLGLSQQEIGEPLSRSFVSLVENGRVSPSLASLVLISGRLHLPAWKLLQAVSQQMTQECESCPRNE